MPDTIRITFIHASGAEREVLAATGQSLMRAAVAAGIEAVVAECGGTLSCGTCHVLFEADAAARVGAPAGDEDAMLELTAAPRQPGSRLACQIALVPALQGLRVRLPASQY